MDKGSTPLKNSKHEAFAKLAGGGKSAAAAYRKFFKCSAATAETNGPKLARDAQVKLRIGWLKQQAVGSARKTASKWVKTKGEWLAWLGQAVLTPIADIDEKSSFAQEVTTDTIGEDGAVMRKKVKSVGKIESLRLIGQWSRFESGTEAENVTADGVMQLMMKVASREKVHD